MSRDSTHLGVLGKKVPNSTRTLQIAILNSLFRRVKTTFQHLKKDRLPFALAMRKYRLLEKQRRAG